MVMLDISKLKWPIRITKKHTFTSTLMWHFVLQHDAFWLNKPEANYQIMTQTWLPDTMHKRVEVTR